MSAPQEPLDLLFVRASVDAWRMGREDGAADEDNLNLAAYAAAILPRLCDELEAARARGDGAAKLLANASREAGELRQRLLKVRALCDGRAAGDRAFVVVAEVRRALGGEG